MTQCLEWKEEWNTGIKELDDMHQAMAAKLNQLIEMFNRAGQKGITTEAIGLKLSELRELTRQHFITEEDAMRRHNFPEYASHKREHAILLAEMSQLIREIVDKGISPDANTERYLKQWFIAHMVIADRDFASYCHALN